MSNNSNTYMRNLDMLLNISSKVLKCSMKRCKKYMNTNDNKIQKLLKVKDSSKKAQAVEKLAAEKTALKAEKCIYNKCKKLHIKLIKVLIKTAKSFLKEYPNVKLLNSNVKNIINELIMLVKKSELTIADINQMNKNKNILIFNILNIRL
jgi:hypothetical protein